MTVYSEEFLTVRKYSRNLVMAAFTLFYNSAGKSTNKYSLRRLHEN